MSGVYIPGFKKPTSQEQCKFFDYAPFRADYCVLFNTCKGIDKCPIVAVPNHGRLIDADALKEEWRNGFHRKIVDALMEDAPTIIPSDKDGAE